jgi:hypothetical protein
MSEKTYRAIVQKVVLRGRHGPFAVATSEELEGSVTVSLESPVWQDSVMPERGMYLILSQVRKKRAGWRAFSGRLVQPSDEPTSKEQREQ